MVRLIIAGMVFLLVGCMQNVDAKEFCNLQESFNLNVFRSKDFKFKSYMCNSEDGLILKNYLESGTERKIVNSYDDLSAKENPELISVSIYKNKKNISPILITIHASHYCCKPQLEGKLYKINLYKLEEKNKRFYLKDISRILGGESEGFDGFSEGRINYKFKEMSSVKQWLDSYYK